MFRATAVAAIVLAFAAVSAAQPQPNGPGGRYMIEFDRAGGSPVHEFPEFNVIAARLPAAAVQALRNHPRVRSIVEDVLRYPFSTGETTPYGISMVQADQIAAGSGVGQAKVCVIDSGYFVGHEDLPPAGLVTGADNSGTGKWTEDQCGHGTHVAGTIAAVNNGKGVVGVLPTGAFRCTS
jgi:serine protease